MTIHEIASQLYDLSLGGYLNREKFSRKSLEEYIRNAFRCESMLKIARTLVMEIALRDGWWHFYIIHYGDSADEYDYVIPDSRAVESRIVAKLQS